MRPTCAWDRASARPHPRVLPISLLALAVATALSACGDSGTSPQAASQDQKLREAQAFTVAGVTYPTVSIQGANATMAVGAHETLSSKLATPTATWMGSFMTYTSSDPSVVSIATQNWGQESGDQAYLTGVKAGTATITATTMSGTAGSVAITVGTPNNTESTGGLHEPAGMTAQINTGAMSAAPSQTSGGAWTEGITSFTNYSPNSMSSTGEWAGNISAVPGGTGVRVTYQPSLDGGNSPVRFGASIPNTGTGHLYLRWKFRLSPNWTLSQANGIKVMEPRTVNSTENHVVNLGAYNGPTNGSSMWSSFLLQFYHNGQTSGYVVPGNNYGQADLTTYFSSPLANLGNALGVWHQMELYAMPESPAGAGNGQLTLCVDGTQVYQTGPGVAGTPAGGMHFFQSGEAEGWSYLMFDPTYGGDQATDHPPDIIYWDIDELYASTK
jgi:hypothetical protein